MELKAELQAPAPWELSARGYILVLKLPRERVERDCFLPTELQGAQAGGLAYVMFVEYLQSPVGAYHELLLIPSAFRVGDRKRWSITKIYVSSQASVDHGRRNWGIPKELAAFDVQYGDQERVDRIAIAVDGQPAVELTLRRHPFGVPLIGGLFPAGMRTLCQELAGSRFSFAPSARGSLRLGKLLSATIDPRFFPVFGPAEVIGVAHVPAMQMTFPVAEIEPAGSV